jgi:actin-like ATPase involved in cell morphogenesis
VGYRLGIDLGTTYVGAAIHREGRAEILSLGSERAVIPSVVYVGTDGSVLVGDAAARRAISEPDRVARGFKRRIGDPTPIVIGGVAWAPHQLTAQLIGSVVAAAREVEGAPPEHVVLCHPATWGAHKLEVYDAAAAAAGLAHYSFLSEPEAAAIHYAASDRMELGRVVAVYDLGGGTFDATVLRRSSAGFEQLGQPAGLEDIGGMDFDAYVFTHVADVLGERLTMLDDTDPDALTAVEALQARCREAKEALSSESEAVVPVALPTGFTTVRINRAELEEWIRPSIDATVRTFRQALASAEVDPGTVDRILLVGGASRTPLVAEMLSGAFGRPLALDAHPKHSVALGAARAAGVAATADSGQLFAAITSEIAFVSAPVANADIEPIVGLEAPRSRRRPAIAAVLAAAAVLVLLIALVTTRGADKKAQLAAGGQSASSLAGALAGSGGSAPSDSTTVAGDLGTVPPGGGATVPGGGAAQLAPGTNGQTPATQPPPATPSTTPPTTAGGGSTLRPPGLVGSFTIANPAVLSHGTDGYPDVIRVTASWSAPTDDGGSAVTGYRIIYTDHYQDGSEFGSTTVNTGTVNSVSIDVPAHKLGNGGADLPYVRWTIAAVNSVAPGAQAVPNSKVPAVLGMSTFDVYFVLWVDGLRVDSSAPDASCGPADTVCTQDPAAGTLRPNGSVVNLKNSS